MFTLCQSIFHIGIIIRREKINQNITDEDKFLLEQNIPFRRVHGQIPNMQISFLSLFMSKGNEKFAARSIKQFREIFDRRVIGCVSSFF